jgi:hypothetical protein
MATIEFSDPLMAGLPERIIRLLGTQPQTQDVAQTGLLATRNSGGNLFSGGAIAELLILKGTVPVDFSGLTVRTSRDADRLITFMREHDQPAAVNIPSNSINDFSPSVTSTNPAVISTIYKPAALSGVATWFWWQVIVGNGAGAWSTAMVHQVIGTVGLVGSGADLEINDTNVVLGEPYRVLNLRIQFPSSWTY